jgi:hypothetical protein
MEGIVALKRQKKDLRLNTQPKTYLINLNFTFFNFTIDFVKRQGN